MSNVHWHRARIDKAARAVRMGQRPCVLWYTGLSGAGKSTLANLVDERLHALGRYTYVLDGDNVRHGLNADLGFSDNDRVENVRRVAEVARLMVDAGLIVSAALISPFRAERRMARLRFEEGEFVEVHVDAPLAVAEARDPKGLYKKARSGELRNFTGIDSPYEPPEAPELRVDTAVTQPDVAANTIVAFLRVRDYQFARRVMRANAGKPGTKSCDACGPGVPIDAVRCPSCGDMHKFSGERSGVGPSE